MHQGRSIAAFAAPDSAHMESLCLSQRACTLLETLIEPLPVPVWVTVLTQCKEGNTPPKNKNVCIIISNK